MDITFTPTAPDANVPQNWYFTFGFGQTCSCGGRYGDVYAMFHGTYIEAREAMFKQYGSTWCAQYSEKQADEAVRRYNLQPIPKGHGTHCEWLTPRIQV